MAGMGGRMSTVIKAKINKLLDKAEDPGETLEYSYQRQMELLQNVKKGIADVATSNKSACRCSRPSSSSRSSSSTRRRVRRSLPATRSSRAPRSSARILAEGQLQSLDQQVAELQQQQETLIQWSSPADEDRASSAPRRRYQGAVLRRRGPVHISEAATGVGEEMADVGLAIQRASRQHGEHARRSGARRSSGRRRSTTTSRSARRRRHRPPAARSDSQSQVDDDSPR